MADPFDLERFVAAQDAVMANVRAELSAGRKRSHWMWFVFPQAAGLGFSTMAERYAIRSRAEARAYLAHPVLGPRLRECTGLVLDVKDRDAHAIFGSPDDLKFRSSMTLFADAGEASCRRALDTFFAGAPDVRTLNIVRGWDG
jgi:uncharacterized protein (DUF1810 family)